MVADRKNTFYARFVPAKPRHEVQSLPEKGWSSEATYLKRYPTNLLQKIRVRTNWWKIFLSSGYSAGL